jgi:hypothetical protein
VIDTNVLLVANGQHSDVSPACVTACSQRLADVIANGRFAIDDGFAILKEYQNKTSHKSGKGPGDAFLKWALRNNANPARCDQIRLVAHPERSFESFPDDVQLKDFDPADRKFVAVASAHDEKPPILQAADSKWLNWAPVLSRHGISVDFLCQGDIERFHRNKSGT